MELHVKSFFRNLTGVLALSLCIFSNCLAQSDTTVTFHYPLNIGDYWEYRINVSGLIVIGTKQVTGDTLMPNGKTYRVIKQDFTPFGAGTSYFRVSDSLEVYLYLGSWFEGEEELVYKLRLRIGDSWRLQRPTLWDSAFVRVDELTKMQILDRNLHVFTINEYGLPDSLPGGPTISVADSLGDIGSGYEMSISTLEGAIIAGKRYGTLTDVVKEDDLIIPKTFELLPNFPNPFNQETTLSFTIEQTQHIALTIYNARGEQIANLLNEQKRPGHYQIVWKSIDEKGAHLTSGIYFSRLVGDKVSRAKKLILVR